MPPKETQNESTHNQPAETTSRLLTVNSVAERLNVSPSTVRRLEANGSLPGLLVGGSLRFEPDAVRQYLSELARARGSASGEEGAQ